MKTEVEELIVEWDDAKDAINFEKHCIHFSSAALVFTDENRLEFYDEKHSETEDRFAVIGMVEDVLFVIYTERKNNLRIISARLATKKEKELYYGKNS